MLLDMLGEGKLHLSGIALLTPHLTPENRETLLRRAAHRTKRQIEELLVELAPRADVPSTIRKLHDRTSSSPASTLSGMGSSVTRSQERAPYFSPARISTDEAPVSTLAVPAEPRVPVSPPPSLPPVIQPLAPGRYRVQFTASAALRDKLERLRALMRLQVPDGDLGAVIEAAVTETLERLEARRFASTSRPRKSLADSKTSPDSRYIPAAVRRAVRKRDGSRCRYVDASGRRCGERHRLHYHHLHTFALGGDHRPENIRLMCKAHDDYLAECDYGREATARFKRGRPRMSGAGIAATPEEPRAPADGRPRRDAGAWTPDRPRCPS